MDKSETICSAIKKQKRYTFDPYQDDAGDAGEPSLESTVLNVVNVTRFVRYAATTSESEHAQETTMTSSFKKWKASSSHKKADPD